MKKSSIKKICAAFVVIIFIVITISLDTSEYLPSYQFCSERGKFVRVRTSDSGPLFKVQQIIYSCSFEADFNDICTQADKELSALGYISDSPLFQTDARVYQLNGNSQKDFILVTIFDNRKYEKYDPDKSSGYYSQDNEFSYQDGWVSVQVEEIKTQKKYISIIKQIFYKMRGSK
ncbi:MAG: hypothetical protein JXA96_10695 [Sedimentisphaerales bacterium]|nr:hypothetical protein [Sedimentisphaerales bacterium]